MLHTLTQFSQTIIEQSSNTYQYGYFITFVRKPYSHHIITKKEVIQKIKSIMENIVKNIDIKFYIFKVVNVGDSIHFNTVHYHCLVFSSTKSFMNNRSLRSINKDSKTTINMKNIYNVTGLLGYIQDKHNILKIYTNNQLLRSRIRAVGQKLETKIILYFSLIRLKIIKGRCYTPT